MLSSQKYPPVLYAQDKKSIFVTVDLPDIKEHTLETTETGIKFKTEKDGFTYSFDIELYANVDEKSWHVTHSNRKLELVASKSNSLAPYWPRLNKTGKLSYIKTDFSKWKDEEESDEEIEKAMNGAAGGGMNAEMMKMMQGMGGMGGGMPGMGGMNPDMLKMMQGMGGDDGEKTDVNIEQVDSDDEEEAAPALESV